MLVAEPEAELLVYSTI